MAEESMARGNISLAHAIHCCPIFFYLLCPNSFCILLLWRICVYTHTHTHLLRRECVWITVATK